MTMIRKSRPYSRTGLFSSFPFSTTTTNSSHLPPSSSGSGSTRPSTIVHVRSSLKAHENRLIPLLPEPHRPLTWYACGPTVYDVAHLGHARNYVSTDILRRILVHHFHYQVHFVLGMTDVDDKIIRRGKETKGCLEFTHFLSLARQYEREFFTDMDRLLVHRPYAVLRVTEHIPEIITFIQRLLDEGFAYTARDGVYFKFSALPNTYNPNKFGNLPDIEYDIEGVGEHDKQDPRDFALWKASSEKEVVGWKSPFGYGRPGWHIECSAMTHAYFGEHLDIHSGGLDLKFPHHTNEILQSECHHCHTSHQVGEKEWVKCWIHTGHLHIEGRKMSKSLKNFISIDDYWQSQLTSSPAEDFRLFCLHHKYSALLTYTPKHIELAEQYRKKLLDFFAMIQVIQTTSEAINPRQEEDSIRRLSCKPSPSSRALLEMLMQTEIKVTEALANDFDTPTALILVNQLLTEGQKYIHDLRQQVFHQIREEGVQMELLAIEPLKAVEDYIRTLFRHSFGIPLRQESSNVSVGGGSDSVLSKDNNDHAFIDAAVDFRSRIRAMAIHGLKALKTKANKSVEEENLYKQLLQECDVARDRMLKEGKVKVEDLGVGQGKWSRDL